jgi:diguanylate cyclase (GGDEF)-like protein
MRPAPARRDETVRDDGRMDVHAPPAAAPGPLPAPRRTPSGRYEAGPLPTPSGAYPTTARAPRPVVRRRISTRLRRVGWHARRLAGDGWTALTVAGGAALLGTGFWPDIRKSGPVSALVVGAASLVGITLLARLTARLVGAPDTTLQKQRDLEARLAKADVALGATLVVALYTVIALSGGLTSPVHPLVFALVAFLVTFHRRAVGIPLIGVVVAHEWLLARAGLPAGVALDQTRRELFTSHLAFIGLFSLVHLVFIQGEVMRRRREHRARVAAELKAMREEARDFRLISSSLAADPKTRSRAADEERLLLGAVETIHLSLFYTLELLKKSLDLHTCVLLWLDESGERLKIKELVTDSDAVTETAVAADAGVIATVVKNRVIVNLRDPKRGHLAYYAGPEEIGAFVGVPVTEDGHLRGVLCADRASDRPFSSSDEALLVGAADQIMRALQSERVFAAVERAKYEHERFFGALAQLNRALGVESVCQKTFEATREICDYDFAALSVIDPATQKHIVLAATGDVPRGLQGTAVEKAGLASMVVKNKHFLPAGGELRDKDAPVFSKKLRVVGMESLLVLPLIAADTAIGSFTVAAHRPRAFGKDKREMLAVIANHVAVSLANAQMYGRMEAMATTDGLTGLVNHRTFQERFDEMLARAERSGSRQALLLTDVDHFKKVNDTYGHPVGDEVLRGVARVVREQVRKVDLAARYGGEEFAIVLEGTDLRGAKETAERIRTEVGKLVFQSAKGPFSVTLSLGIAVFGPDSNDGRDKKTLIANADQSLYHAKHNGRNQAVAWSDISSSGKVVKKNG